MQAQFAVLQAEVIAAQVYASQAQAAAAGGANVDSVIAFVRPQLSKEAGKAELVSNG